MLTNRKDRTAALAATFNAGAKIATAAWDESVHPRSPNGEFGEGDVVQSKTLNRTGGKVIQKTGAKLIVKWKNGQNTTHSNQASDLKPGDHTTADKLKQRQETKNQKQADTNLRRGGHTVDHNDLPYDFQNWLKDRGTNSSVWNGANIKERKDLVKEYLS